jgi:phage repressor protein C with HTH and peptisase S24 domain
MPAGDHSDIHDDLMRFRPEGMTPNGWATKAGVSRTVWSDMRRHGNPSRRTLEKLLTAAGSSLAEFEALRIGRGSEGAVAYSPALSEHRGPSWEQASPSSMPLYATAMAGYWGDPAARIELIELRSGEIIDRVRRPPSLANDERAYAVIIVGDSMWPRFRPGRHVAVSPKAPIAIGDDVIVRLRGTLAKAGVVDALLKELVYQGRDRIELRQFNPDGTFLIDAHDVAAIEKVVGELI